VVGDFLMSDSIYIYPTDTVWGIGANIYSQKGQEAIRKIKKSSLEKPMSVLFPGRDILSRFINYPTLWNDLFELEITFLIPSKWCNEEIPSWVATGPYVGIRCLENAELDFIKEKENAPITSTSLNLSGGEPITSLEDVTSFMENEAKSCELIHFKDREMSGMSSTIVKVEEDKNYEIIRAGANVEKIKDILGLSAT
jgi:L-threonylcarbamoyladenylate synthase